MPSEPQALLRPFSVDSVPWTEWDPSPRFGLRYRHLSRAALGPDYRIGVALEELPPGKRSGPAHYHLREEEHLYVLEGSLTLRLGEQTHRLSAGGYACFPAGQRAAHCLVNDGDQPCRYLMIGENDPHDVVVYPNGGKVLVRAFGPGGMLDAGAVRGYWDGEETGLPAGQTPPAPGAPTPAPEPSAPRPPLSADDVPWDAWDLAPGFTDRNRHLTRAAVGDDYRVGVLIEGPPPGTRPAPRHYHMREEEHALILEGEVTLILGEERIPMRAGDYVAFPAGRRVGHSFLNSGAGPCAYLMIGAHDPADIVVLADTDKMVVRGIGLERDIFDMTATRAYLEGEPPG